jgi:hypothetical protein
MLFYGLDAPMDELPDLLTEAVGDASLTEQTDLGGGDIIAVTPAETYLYRSEGLLSDESIETYSHDVEGFGVDVGRRKTTVLLEGIDTEQRLTVPSDAVNEFVEALLEGVLRTTGVLSEEETIEEQFRFSELTFVVTDRQLLKHVGSAVWNAEYEAYPYSELTDLDFESGSVAMQVIVQTDARRQRVKVPNDHSGRVRDAVQRAVFEYHGVSSLGGLRAILAPDEDSEDSEEGPTGTASAGYQADETDDTAGGSGSASDGESSAGGWSPPADQDINSRSRVGAGSSGESYDTDPEPTTTEETAPGGETVPAGDGADVEALAERVDTLSEQLDRQTELLESQQELIDQLVDELRRGR